MSATREIELGKLRLGAGNPLFLIAGPCVIETESHARAMAEKIAKVAADRLAEETGRGLRQGRAVIAVPSQAALALRTLALVPSRLRESMRNTLLPSPDSIGEAADEAAIARKSATGGTGD